MKHDITTGQRRGTAKHQPALSEQAIALILSERIRQDILREQGRFLYTLFDTAPSESEKLASIMEEMGEVGRNVLARALLVSDGDRTDDALLKELTQVAALSLAWMERLIEDSHVRDA